MAKKSILYTSLFILLILSVLSALLYGSTFFPVHEIIMGLLKCPGYEKQSLIIYTIRLPRVLGAILAGVGLSVSGVLLQSVTNNELAGPNIIGINAGAGISVILLLYFLPGRFLWSPVFAFVGAFATSLLILFISNKINASGASVILAGIAVTTLINAGISMISLLDSDVLSSYNAFSVGGLSSVITERLLLPAVIIFISLAVAILLSDKADTLLLGDSVAYSLGIRVKLIRVVCLIISSACAASVVSFAGLLGFVGLVVPHMARRLCGNLLKKLIPVSALLGAILVVLADLFGRVLFAPSEIPVGIVMALIGAPFFFVLLLRRRHNA